MNRQKIVAHLWFDKQVKEAAAFHVAAFGGDSGVTKVTGISGTPEQRTRVTQAFLKMKKFDISPLERAYAGQ